MVLDSLDGFYICVEYLYWEIKFLMGLLAWGLVVRKPKCWKVSSPLACLKIVFCKIFCGIKWGATLTLE